MSRLEVDFEVSAGSFAVQARFTAGAGITALFGPSGAGKSVTLATIAGLLRPSSGTVVIDGEEVADPVQGVHVPTQGRQIGMVFQHPSLLPHRSPLENVALAARAAPDRPARREMAGGWLERVHASHLATAPVTTLSGGEQQRIALARALVGHPRLLLLDEPFSALDRPTRSSLRRLVRELVTEQQITALLVTHDLDDIVTLADRVVLFEPGRTIASHELAGAEPGDLVRLLGLAS